MLPPPSPDQAYLDQQRRATGDRIRRARRLQGLRQEGLAERAGLDRKTVSRLENGRALASHDQLARVAYALELPLWRLFWDE
ncbi:helix-turn-helix transcriptional regulator [Streptomyces sp. LS1784]|uniref:helix-turn-helix transcriptional regulator n=1 Tax=Streptomyces sp. LS1784 TaxID=2851533 RepID=UPI001CCEA0B8|nr:helix-turn-helix transcriptional regulator [Streptomyces sp. LS1784]